MSSISCVQESESPITRWLRENNLSRACLARRALELSGGSSRLLDIQTAIHQAEVGMIGPDELPDSVRDAITQIGLLDAFSAWWQNLRRAS